MEWTRESKGGLHQIEVFECPVEVLAILASESRGDVTIENIRPVAGIDRWFESALTLPQSSAPRQYTIRNATFDLALKNDEFLKLMPFWDDHGVYAVFTERSPVAFQASGLPESARYRALQNFGFILEFALAGPSSAGWSRIVSPEGALADLAEEILGRRAAGANI